MAQLLTPPTRPTKVAKVTKVSKKAMSRKTPEKVATPLCEPHMVEVYNPQTCEYVSHFGYEAKVQHTSKPDEVRTILCSRLNTVRIGEPVMVVYHTGMKTYKHSRYVSVSNSDNCAGGFHLVKI